MYIISIIITVLLVIIAVVDSNADSTIHISKQKSENIGGNSSEIFFNSTTDEYSDNNFIDDEYQ